MAVWRALAMVPVLVACGPPAGVTTLTRTNVQSAAVFERATANLLTTFGNSNVVNVTAQTAPCIATSMTTEEQNTLATRPSTLAPMMPQILGRPTAQFCMSGGAL